MSCQVRISPDQYEVLGPKVEWLESGLWLESGFRLQLCNFFVNLTQFKNHVIFLCYCSCLWNQDEDHAHFSSTKSHQRLGHDASSTKWFDPIQRVPQPRTSLRAALLWLTLTLFHYSLWDWTLHLRAFLFRELQNCLVSSVKATVCGLFAIISGVDCGNKTWRRLAPKWRHLTRNKLHWRMKTEQINPWLWEFMYCYCFSRWTGWYSCTSIEAWRWWWSNRGTHCFLFLYHMSFA